METLKTCAHNEEGIKEVPNNGINKKKKGLEALLFVYLHCLLEAQLFVYLSKPFFFLFLLSSHETIFTHIPMKMVSVCS